MKHTPYEIPTKEAERLYAQALRKEAKGRGYKFTSDSVWKVDRGFIIDGLSLLARDRQGAYLSAMVKTLVQDDILWDIYGMESNKSERTSLRVTGVFTTGGIRLGGYTPRGIFFEVAGIDGFGELAAEVVGYLDREAVAFLDSIGWDQDAYFETVIATPPYRNEDYDHEQLIARIALGRIEETLDIANALLEEDPTRSLINRIGDKSDVELFKEYCERALSGKKERGDGQ